MTSERQRAANRDNAKKSTGPRSQAGKKRTSQNAHRHGLAAPAPLQGDGITRLEELTSEIVKSTAGRIGPGQARAIAQAELEVQRVRAAVTSTIAQGLVGADCRPLAIPRDTSARLSLPEEGADLTVEAVVNALPCLRVLDRYHRRAIANRNRTISACFKGIIED